MILMSDFQKSTKIIKELEIISLQNKVSGEGDSDSKNIFKRTNKSD